MAEKRLRNYQRREQAYQKLVLRLEKDFGKLYRWKIVILLGEAAMLAGAVILRSFPLGGAVFFFGVLMFVVLDIRQARVMHRQRTAEIFRTINHDSSRRLLGDWKTFTDTGEDFQDDQHPYSGDLDLFGQSSFFQWINCARTFGGRREFAKLLVTVPKDTESIRARQEAVSEMAKLLHWRQRLMAEAMLRLIPAKDPAPLIGWAGERLPFFQSSRRCIGIRILPFVTLLVAIAVFIWKLPGYPLALLLLIHYFILRYRRREREDILAKVGLFHNQLQNYSRLFHVVESRSFHSSLLNQLQQGLKVKGRPVFRQIEQLAQIADTISNRNNLFYGLVNWVTLLDYYCLFALEHWKAVSGSRLSQWLEVLGKMEALASLAVIRYDHPDWAFPQVHTGEPLYEARELGHPLLEGGRRVCNDLVLRHRGDALLITGSNMSGKSTYLRTAGINLVLAYAGAPVCAATMSCRLMKMVTCMRIGDNLTENISSFYAEILRIKQIVDATQTGDPVFFLLDEIFRGTNSKDRHTGARVLIAKLSKVGACGMVSTHDLELAAMEKNSEGRIKNYHFQEYYQGKQIHFDYKLRPGVSTTRNAIYLIRSAGIDIDEDELKE